jgi:hypothetical protein
LQNGTNGCLESNDKKSWARLCYSHSEVSLDLKNNDISYTLIIDPQKNKNIPTYENPATYTKNQLIDRALNLSFQSRISFERLVQAKLNAKVAIGNLFPHFSTNTFVGIYTPSITSVLKVIGDLVPFLLPNRWAKADEASSQFKAQFNGWITMKADAGNTVDGLSLVLLQGEQTLEKLKANEVLVTQIRDQIKSRETTGILQIGSSDDVTAVINSIDQAIADIQEAQMNGYATLSQASGFINPKAITILSLTTDENTIDTPYSYDPEQIKRLALERSYELRQVDFLIDAARKKEKVESVFNWMDPNGDANGSLGLGFPNYIKIAESDVRQILIERERVQSIILEKVEESLNEINLAIRDRKLARDGRDIEDRRIARITNNMKLGINYALADLVTAFQGKVRNDLALTGAGYRYLVAWSKLQRLIYAGPYANLARGNEYLPTFKAETENAE